MVSAWRLHMLITITEIHKYDIHMSHMTRKFGWSARSSSKLDASYMCYSNDESRSFRHVFTGWLPVDHVPWLRLIASIGGLWDKGDTLARLADMTLVSHGRRHVFTIFELCVGYRPKGRLSMCPAEPTCSMQQSRTVRCVHVYIHC